MQQIQSEEEFQEIISQPEPLVVYWFAEWCGSCKSIHPYFSDMESQYPTVKFVKVDVDQMEDLSAKENIKAMPTFYFYNGGERVDSFRGAQKDAFKKMMAKHF